MHRYTDGMPSLIFRSSSLLPLLLLLLLVERSAARGGSTSSVLSARGARWPPRSQPPLPIDAIGIPDRRNAFFLKLPRWWRSVATTPSSSPPPPVKRGRVENSGNSTTIPASVAHPRSRSNVRTFEKLKRSRPLIPPLDIYLYIYTYMCVSVCVHVEEVCSGYVEETG